MRLVAALPIAYALVASGGAGWVEVARLAVCEDGTIAPIV